MTACQNCGIAVEGEYKYCHSCGAKLEKKEERLQVNDKTSQTPNSSEDIEWALSTRKHALGLYGLSVLYAIIVTVIWTLAGHYVGSSWLLPVVNIVGFLVSAALLGVVARRALKVLMPTPLAWLCALATWAVAVLLLRSLIVAWLRG